MAYGQERVLSMQRMSVKDFQFLFDVTIPPFEACTGRGREPVTVKQRAQLHEAGLNTTGLKCKSQATAIIKTLNKRQEMGLCDVHAVLLILATGARPRTPYRIMTQKHALQIISRKLY